MHPILADWVPRSRRLLWFTVGLGIAAAALPRHAPEPSPQSPRRAIARCAQPAIRDVYLGTAHVDHTSTRLAERMRAVAALTLAEHDIAPRFADATNRDARGRHVAVSLLRLATEDAEVACQVEVAVTAHPAAARHTTTGSATVATLAEPGTLAHELAGDACVTTAVEAAIESALPLVR